MADLERGTAAAPARVNTERGLDRLDTEQSLDRVDMEQRAELEQLPTLFSRLGDEVMQLFDTKISLLKVEVKEEAREYTRDVGLIATGGVIAALGFALANVAVALFVSTFFSFRPAVNYALGFVLTGVVYMIVGGILVVTFKNHMAKHSPVPNRSVQELRKDKQWLKNEI
jgi:uncharacterized membrane protein YqjE